MRTAGTIHPTSTTTVTAATATSKATFSPPETIQRSQWHSPVPYLFGGLAGMLGLITFALLILACSYWKLSDHSNNRENGDRDIEAGEENSENTAKALPDFEEKIVVIMAGDVKATFLATPISSRAASFGDGNCCKSKNKVTEKSETAEKPKEEIGGHEPTPPAAAAAPPTTTTENRETGETHASQEQNQ